MTTERWTDEMLDKLAEAGRATAEAGRATDERLKELAMSIKELREESATRSAKIDQEITALSESIKQLREESKEQSYRFTTYQQAAQWVVNLAFGLMATATVTTIISSVYRR